MAKNITHARSAILVVLAMVLLGARTAVFVSAGRVKDNENGECVDSNPTNCPYWAKMGECEANPGYMHVHCKKSCDRCHKTRAKDRDEINKIIAQRQKEFQERQKESRKTATATISSTGEVETSVDSAATTRNGNQGNAGSTSATISSSSTTKPNKKKAKIDVSTGMECVDLDENCPFWAATGDCLNNRNFMSTNCRLSCDRCHIVRVNNADEIRQFIERKNKETEQKRQALKEQKEINKILQGEL